MTRPIRNVVPNGLGAIAYNSSHLNTRVRLIRIAMPQRQQIFGQCSGGTVADGAITSHAAVAIAKSIGISILLPYISNWRCLEGVPLEDWMSDPSGTARRSQEQKGLRGGTASSEPLTAAPVALRSS